MHSADLVCPTCGASWGERPAFLGNGRVLLECPDCWAKTWERARRESWEKYVAARKKRYEPELGQLAFGNAWGEYQLDDDCEGYATNELYALIGRLGGYVWEASGPDFELREYVWDDCTCDGAGTCRACRPNFRMGDLEIRWYKHPGRGMSVNRPTTREELERVFDRARLMVSAGLITVHEGDRESDG